MNKRLWDLAGQVWGYFIMVLIMNLLIFPTGNIILLWIIGIFDLLFGLGVATMTISELTIALNE